MDISELLPYGVVTLVLVSFVAVRVVALRSSKRWLRWCVRIGTSTGMALTMLVLAWLVVGDFLFTVRAPLLYSPDGKHVAVLTWGEPEFATVKVRHRYSPFAATVYSGPGLSGGTEPQVRWIDNNYLLLRYDDWDKGDRVCVPHAFNIDIICQHPL